MYYTLTLVPGPFYMTIREQHQWHRAPIGFQVDNDQHNRISLLSIYNSSQSHCVAAVPLQASVEQQGASDS